MPRIEISLTRFKWKPAPWLVPENVVALWIYSDNGDLTYELELVPGVTLPKMDPQHAKNSKNAASPNFVRMSDSRIIDVIESRIKDLDVSGARGRGIIVGELVIPLGKSQKKVLTMSTLRDWKDWMENKRNFKPHKK